MTSRILGSTESTIFNNHLLSGPTQIDPLKANVMLRYTWPDFTHAEPSCMAESNRVATRRKQFSNPQVRCEKSLESRSLQ